MKSRKHRGFTLIELLVAVVILASVITTITLVYRGALVSSQKAAVYVQTGAVLPAILTEVRSKIRNSPFSEQTLLGQGQAGVTTYSWYAQQIQDKKVFDRPGSNEFGIVALTSNHYKLWLVSLELENKGAKQSFSFHEVSWLER